MRDRYSSKLVVKGPAHAWLVGLALLSSAPGHGQDVEDTGVGVRSVSAAAQPCLNVRSRPSYRALTIDCLTSGTEVTVTMVRDGWSYVTTATDTAGWVGSRFLVAEAEETRAAADAGIESGAIERRGSEYPNRELELLRQAALERQDLETELERARAAWNAAADEAGDLRARLEELTAERESLTRQLARAEARILYVLSDLEETRAELMRLKGIPPKLVQPEAPVPDEPAAPPPVAEPEPEPEPDAVPDAFVLPVDANFAVLDEVVATVRAWAQAWSDQRVEDYLSFYAPTFAPASGESREAWAATRRQRVAAPSSVEVTLDDITPIASAGRASVTFVQTYTSDTFSDRVTKTLVLERADGGSWQIVEERTD